VQLPPISVVEQTVPVDTSVQRLFGSPWNRQQAKFLLSCSEPVSAKFGRLIVNDSIISTTPVRSLRNVSGYGVNLLFILNLSGWPDGRFVASFHCTNGVGERDSIPAMVTWVLDSTPPTTTIALHPAAIEASSVATFVLACSEVEKCSYMFQVDGVGQWGVVGGHQFDGERTVISAITQFRGQLHFGSTCCRGERCWCRKPGVYCTRPSTPLGCPWPAPMWRVEGYNSPPTAQRVLGWTT
jgi:hypothetical protein